MKVKKLFAKENFLMQTMKFYLKRFLGIIAFTSVFLLNSCATPGQIKGSFEPIKPNQAQSGNYIGKNVRWGGEVIKTLPEKNGSTCFIVLGLKLNSYGKPLSSNIPNNFIGRFMACSRGYFDPKIYQNRKITFVGTIDKVEIMKVGNFDYPYPMLKAKTFYLWPKSRKLEYGRSNYGCGFSLLPCY